MSSELLDAFRHSAWSNRRLLEACATMTPEQLGASLPTGAGQPLTIMKHLIGAEGYYLSLLTGKLPDWEWDDEATDTAEELIGFARLLEHAWERLLADSFEGNRMLDTHRSRIKAGVLLAQALHHGNVHREQVSAIMTSQGIAPPDVSAWAYGRESGGIVSK